MVAIHSTGEGEGLVGEGEGLVGEGEGLDKAGISPSPATQSVELPVHASPAPAAAVVSEYSS